MRRCRISMVARWRSAPCAQSTPVGAKPRTRVFLFENKWPKAGANTQDTDVAGAGLVDNSVL